jgi:hypothetical protein
MNGKQLFCLSLIILSVAMGLHWFKNRPKKQKKRTNRPRVALNIDDLQIQDEEDTNSGTLDENTKPDDKQDADPDAADEDSDGQTNDSQDGEQNIQDTHATDEEQTASGTEEIVAVASKAIEIASELDDPIIASLRSLPRNPFQESPYALLVEQLRAAEDEADEVVEDVKKEIQVLQANFTGTIKTPSELVAVIDSRLYRQGDFFQDRRITQIKNELVAMDTGPNLFLIPKVGVKVDIATDGTYTYEDSFQGN